jgi:hypothetical protein
MCSAKKAAGAHLGYDALHLPVQRPSSVHCSVGMDGGGSNISQACRADRGVVLAANRIRSAAAVLHIALETPLEANIIGRVDIDAQPVQGEQLGIVEGEKAFDDHV